MPDRHGFDHLGASVRCIDCPQGGPAWKWPEERRYEHGQTHRPTQAPITPESRRQRNLLTAPPRDTNEESKETSTMTATKPSKVESTKDVTIDLLRQAGEPLPAKEIAKRVIDSGRCTNLKGKTPEATISAMLAVGSKPGGPFKRVAKGTYAVADVTTNETDNAEPHPPTVDPGEAKAEPPNRQTKLRTSKPHT